MELGFEYSFIAEKKIEEWLIKEIWENIKTRLVDYDVKDIKMPVINAFVLKERHYLKACRELAKKSKFRETVLIEYGELFPAIHSAGFAMQDQSEDDEGWLICIRKGKRSITVNLEHELCHIFEYLLGLKWGTLTEKT